MDNISIYLKLAEDYLKQDNFLGAITAYESIIQLAPDRPQFYLILGDLFANLQQYPKAVQAYKKAKQLDPKLPFIHRKLASVLQKQAETTKEILLNLHFQGIKEYPNKLIHYHKLLEFQPRNLDLYFGLVQALIHHKQLDEAIVICQIPLIFYPNSITFQEKINEILTLKDEENEKLKLDNYSLQENQYPKSLEDYRRVLKLKPEHPQVYHHLANQLLKLEAWEDLVTCYQELLKITPLESQLYHHLGDAFLKLEQWQNAVKCYHQAIKLNPAFSWSYHNLGDAFLKLEQWQNAVKCYHQAIKLNPDFVWSYYNLAEAFLHLKQWEQAIINYYKALNRQPNLPFVTQKLARAFYQQGLDYLNQSLSYYEQIIMANPTDLESYQQTNQLKILLNQEETLIPKSFNSTSLAPQIYQLWWETNAPQTEDLLAFSHEIYTFKYRPIISIIVPVYHTSENFLRDTIESVLAQVYPDWELTFVDNISINPYVQDILNQYTAKDGRIKVILNSENQAISAVLNSALTLATGEFICVPSNHDLLTPDALFQVVKLLNQHPEADFIYSDEDNINDQGTLDNPHFKPDWCPDSFLSRMYTGNLAVYRHSLLKQIGGFRLGYEGSQDYDLVLRLTEKTQHIFHIPKILYHSRNTLKLASENNQTAIKALQDALFRRGEKGTIIPHNTVKGFYTVRYEITDYQLVSIIIPTRNLGNVLNRCLQSIFTKTTYPNYEVIVIDNGSDETETIEVFNYWQKLEPKRFSFHRLDVPFNYSQLNNYGVSISQGDYLLFLNNDTEVINSDWLNAMVEQAHRPIIGAVGATLLYPDDTIQHAGIILGIGAVAGHGHRYFSAQDFGYFGQLISVNNYSAVSGACLMCRRDVFNQVSGFDDSLKVTFNDVDFCLKIREKGYQIICLPHVTLYHFESQSRGYENTPEKQERFQQEINITRTKWDTFIKNDPCYHPNLTRLREDYSLALNTRIQVLDISVNPLNLEKLAAFSFDLPKVGILETPFLSFSGWIVGRNYPVSELKILHNQNIIATIPVQHIRPDIATLFPDIFHSINSGFSFSFFSIYNLPSHCQLSLHGFFPDHTFIPLATFSISHQVIKN